MPHYYSIKKDGVVIFNNTNTACYAETLGGPKDNFVSTYCKPGQTLELYLPQESFIGKFAEKECAERFFKILNKMGFSFEFHFTDKLPRNLEAGYVVSFNLDTKEPERIKLGVYLIRFMWEGCYEDFAKDLFQIFDKYKGRFCYWRLLKYAYYNLKFFKTNAYFGGHSVASGYYYRNYEKNLEERLKVDWNCVYSLMFASEVNNYKYPSLRLDQNAHLPRSLEDAIENLPKYIKNPKKELDV